MVTVVIVDPDYGTFLEYRSQALNAFFADGIVEMRAIFSDRNTIGTGFGDMNLVLDQSHDPVILPAITPAEHFRVMEAFHNHKVFGITGMGTNNQSEGIYYCIRIADELKRSENAIMIVSSGWVFGPRQYALDIVLMHWGTKQAELVPGWSRNWNVHSVCKLQRWALPQWLEMLPSE